MGKGLIPTHQPTRLSITHLDILRSGNCFIFKLGRDPVLGSPGDSQKRRRATGFHLWKTEVKHQGLYAPGTIMAKAFCLPVREITFIMNQKKLQVWACMETKKGMLGRLHLIL